MFKRIIVAIDGSEHSHKTLKYAKELAQSFEAIVWLVYAFPRTSDLLGYDEYEKLVARRENAGQDILDAARQNFDSHNLDIHEELLEGPPAEAILSVAEARKADLIVMGTRGMGALQGLVFGSVSNKVAHYAECPVMLVR